MVCNKHLISFHIVERESNQNFLAWTYPTITQETRNYLLSKCFSNNLDHSYLYLRKNNTWLYIQHSNSINLNKKFAVVVLTGEFEPNKYEPLCDILSRKYSKCGSPVELVKLYLNLFTVGSCSLQENGTLFACDLENFKPYSNLKDLIKLFGLEVILIYSAILLKRRVLVYNDNMKNLQRELYAITNLVPYPCRNLNEYFYPLINTPRELKGLSFYVSGTTNLELLKETNLYDIFVNTNTQDVTISPQAQEIMKMTKIHKEIATVLVQLAKSDLDEEVIKQQILNKTNDVINKLKSLTSVSAENGVKMLTSNDLKSKNYHPSVENFLFNLALAENIMML